MISVIAIHFNLAIDYKNAAAKDSFEFGIKALMWCLGICLFTGFCSLILCLIGVFNHEKWKYILVNGLLNISLIPFALLPFWKWMI